MPVDRENGSPPYIVNPVTGNKSSVSRALRIMSRNQGWDPDIIYDQGTGKELQNIANFNKDPDSFKHDGLGTLPQGTPDSFPEDHGSVGQGVDWQHPEHNNGNTPARRTSNADPTPEMPGA